MDFYKIVNFGILISKRKVSNSTLFGLKMKSVEFDTFFVDKKGLLHIQETISHQLISSGI